MSGEEIGRPYVAQSIEGFVKDKGDARRDEILGKLKDSSVPIKAVDAQAVADAVKEREVLVRTVANAADQAPRDGFLDSHERTNAGRTIGAIEDALDYNETKAVASPLSAPSTSPRIQAFNFLDDTAKGIMSDAKVNGVEKFVDEGVVRADINKNLGDLPRVAAQIAKISGEEDKLEHDRPRHEVESELEILQSTHEGNADLYRVNITHDWNDKKGADLKNIVDSMRSSNIDLKPADGKPFEGANPGSKEAEVNKDPSRREL